MKLAEEGDDVDADEGRGSGECSRSRPGISRELFVLEGSTITVASACTHIVVSSCTVPAGSVAR